MKNIFALCLTLSVLSGCAAFQPDMTDEIINSRIDTECPIDKKGQAAKRQRCIRDIYVDEAADSPKISNFLAYKDQTIGLAEQYDSGKLSQDRYEALSSDIRARSKVDAAIIEKNIAIQEQYERDYQDRLDNQRWLDYERYHDKKRYQQDNRHQDNQADKDRRYQEMMRDGRYGPRPHNCQNLSGSVNCTNR